jgi:hypothetical protein
MIDGNATVATVELIGDNEETITTVTGSSVRAPGDKHNAEIAVHLAVGRAFEKLGRKLVRRGNGLVKAADNIAADKRARKAKAAVETLPPFAPMPRHIRAFLGLK